MRILHVRQADAKVLLGVDVLGNEEVPEASVACLCLQSNCMDLKIYTPSLPLGVPFSGFWTTCVPLRRISSSHPREAELPKYHEVRRSRND